MRIACVQFAPAFADISSNVSKVSEFIDSVDAELLIFPEAALSGYCFTNFDEADSVAITQDSGAIADLLDVCRKNSKAAVIGYVERDGNSLFNSAIFIGSGGVIGNYRKAHLPCLGLDRFVSHGDALPLFDFQDWKIGIQICFDIRFPEATRTLALAGADLVAVPTNWPESAEASSDFICPARASENQIFVAAANRVGVERDFRFIGKSIIIGPGATILASADHAEETVLIADVDLAESRVKRIVKVKGEYELDLWGERRPDLYRFD